MGESKSMVVYSLIFFLFVVVILVSVPLYIHGKVIQLLPHNETNTPPHYGDETRVFPDKGKSVRTREDALENVSGGYVANTIAIFSLGVISLTLAIFVLVNKKRLRRVLHRHTLAKVFEAHAYD